MTHRHRYVQNQKNYRSQSIDNYLRSPTPTGLNIVKSYFYLRDEMNCRHITVLLILWCNSVLCITVDDFTDYGLEHGDTRAPTNDDGSTLPIPVRSLFPFFNHQHDSLIVSI
jgi:hypothetical protein